MILLEKLLSAILAGYLTVTLPWPALVMTFIVLGQGHFFTAYLYQGLAGKLRWNYLAWIAVLLTAYWLYPFPAGLTAIATIYFAVHMAIDELYLSRSPLQLQESPMHLGRFLEMLPLIVIYAAAVSDAMLHRGAWLEFPALDRAARTVAAMALVFYLILVTAGGYRPDRRSAYFLLPGAGLYLASQIGWLARVPAPKLSGFIILYHYFNWYIHYGLNTGDRRKYLQRVTLVNALVVAVFLMWGTRGPGWVLFQERNFYLWTMLHLITSTRAADLKGVTRWP